MVAREVAVKMAVLQRESKKEIFGDVSISKITINIAKVVDLCRVMLSYAELCRVMLSYAELC